MAARCCLVLIAALSLAAAAPAVGGADAPSRVVLIALENHEYDEVIGAAEAPFLNKLAARGALATDYHAIRHPSLPNYLALLGGSTYGVRENCTGCMTPGPNLATQLSAAGVAWRAYMGAMPHACFAGAEAGDYVKRHNPFMHSTAIASNPALCRRVVPETSLDADLRRQRLPAFAWLSPDLCDDAHDCGLGSADRHLATLIPRITHQLGPHGKLVVTFDEGTSDAGCCGGAAGGRVATILVGPDIRPGTRLHRPSDHYSLLAALEDHFGLARLHHARGANPLPLASPDNGRSPKAPAGRIPWFLSGPGNR